MRKLLAVTAWVEVSTGVALIAAPGPVVSLLAGAVLDTAGWLVARVAGAALLALGLACWLARNDGRRPATLGLVAAMLLYNLMAAALLVHAGISLQLTAIGLWPAVALHVALALWCVICLKAEVAPSV